MPKVLVTNAPEGLIYELQSTNEGVLPAQVSASTIGAVSSPLLNAFWIDPRGAAAGPGLPFRSDTDGAFSTFAAAFAAVDPTSPILSLFCVEGDLSAGGMVLLDTVGTFTAEGISGAAWKLEPDFVSLPPFTGTGSNVLQFRNVLITAVAGASLVDVGSVTLSDCQVNGSIDSGNPIVATQTVFRGDLDVAGSGPVVTSCEFRSCDVTDTPDFSTPAAFADEESLANFGRGSVSRVDANPFWFLLGTLEQTVVMRTANRTVNNAGAWTTQRAWVAQNTLTGNLVLTVTMTDAPALALFTVENYDTLSGNTLTVNGTVVAGKTRVTFQNIAATLTPLLVEVLA